MGGADSGTFPSAGCQSHGSGEYSIGARIGLSARTPDDILVRAREEINRAWEIGQGSDGRAAWLRPHRWVEPAIAADETTNWPPQDWPDFRDFEDLKSYAGYRIVSRYYRVRDDEGNRGGPVFVRPHVREGQPVTGHSRSLPAR